MIDMNEGEMYADNIDLKKSNMNLNLTIIPQEDYFFEGTVKDNITLYGEIDNRFNEILQLLDSEFLNDNLELVIQKKGSNISGGQKQMISIARALYFKSEILLIDEGLSAIDHKNKLKILDKLTNIKGITILLIEHNYDKKIIKKFDEVIIVSNKKIDTKRVDDYILS